MVKLHEEQSVYIALRVNVGGSQGGFVSCRNQGCLVWASVLIKNRGVEEGYPNSLYRQTG